MTGWRETTIADLAAPVDHALATGPFGSAISSRYFVDEGVPVIRGSNLSTEVGVRLKDDGLAFLTTEKARTFHRSMARRGDLVFTCWGTVGQIGYIDDRARYDCYVVSNKQMKLTPDPEKVLSPFLYYALSSEELVAQVTGQAIGSAVPGFNLGQLRNIRLVVPDLQAQRRVVRVLGSIDDLIENNRRRAEVLEEMARTIYREWFVHFRFPGHEGATFHDSALGPIPELWAANRLDSVASVVRGRSYRKVELVEKGDGLPFLNLKCMQRGGGFRRDGLKWYDGKYKEAQLIGQGDIVLAVTDLTQGREILARATLVPPLPMDKGVISLDVAKIVPNDPAERLWIFGALRWSDFADRVKEFANGSTVLHLSPTHVAEASVLWAPKELRRRFASTIRPMISMADEVVQAADRAASFRDLLLPKLVTGQIDVSRLDLDAVVERAGV